MKIDFSGLLFAVSYALDCVESELTGVSTGHAKRVACCCTTMGKKLGMSDDELRDLAAFACLHDNALTQYISEELRAYHSQDMTSLRSHCLIGERNLQKFPFFTKHENVIMYHHETADGKGPFGIAQDQTPVMSQLIHIADVVDVQCNLGNENDGKYGDVSDFLEDTKGSVFSPECVDLFLDSFSTQDMDGISNEEAVDRLKATVPVGMCEYSYQEIVDVMDMIAKIIDYKSEFTRLHSIGVARRAFEMGAYMGYSEDMCYRLYIAGALHDIGEMAINNDILEKPSLLTEKEYIYIQTHAYYTWKILSQIDGFEDITRWASFHHEKLDGSGYPFGIGSEKLDDNCRLMACIDIYQALGEERPYKKAMDHDNIIKVMNGLACDGKIDAGVVNEMDKAMRGHVCDSSSFESARDRVKGKQRFT